MKEIQLTQNKVAFVDDCDYERIKLSLRQKWRAQIQINGIKKHLGLFIDEHEAFEVYKQAVNGLGEKIIEGIALR